MSRPGTARSTSVTVRYPWRSISCRVMTVVAAPISLCSSGVAVALTTTVSERPEAGVGEGGGAGVVCASVAAEVATSMAPMTAVTRRARREDRRARASRPNSTAVPARSARSVFQNHGIAAT